MRSSGRTWEGGSQGPGGCPLSYGYAIILGQTVSALCAAGLDAAIGFFRSEQDRRPSLALDLMEKFRPLVVDQVVIAAARRSELRPEHGYREEAVHGVLLTKVAASLGDQHIPVHLARVLGSLDHANITLVTTAITRANG